MKRQSLDIGKARSFIWQDARRPLLISVLVSLSEMSAQGLASGSDSEWAVVERKAVVVSAAALAATAPFFAISWCCFPMSTFLDTLQSRSGWHSGLQDITWHLLLMPQRKASKVTYYQHATITANMMDYQACCPHLKNKNKTSYNLKRRTGDNLATQSRSGSKDSGQLAQQRERQQRDHRQEVSSWWALSSRRRKRETGEGTRPSHYRVTESARGSLTLLPASVMLSTKNTETWKNEQWASAGKIPAASSEGKRKRKQILKERKRIQPVTDPCLLSERQYMLKVCK